MQKTIFRRLTALLLCLALLVPAGAIPSFAEGETRAAIVNGDNVNVRSGPGTNNGIVATLSYGHALTVTGEGVASQSPGTPNLWYPVTFQSGMATLSGYMYSDYVLFKTEGQEEPTNGPVEETFAPLTPAVNTPAPVTPTPKPSHQSQPVPVTSSLPTYSAKPTPNTISRTIESMIDANALPIACKKMNAALFTHAKIIMHR